MGLGDTTWTQAAEYPEYVILSVLARQYEDCLSGQAIVTLISLSIPKTDGFVHSYTHLPLLFATGHRPIVTVPFIPAHLPFQRFVML